MVNAMQERMQRISGNVLKRPNPMVDVWPTLIDNGTSIQKAQQTQKSIFTGGIDKLVVIFETFRHSVETGSEIFVAEQGRICIENALIKQSKSYTFTLT